VKGEHRTYTSVRLSLGAIRDAAIYLGFTAARRSDPPVKRYLEKGLRRFGARAVA
jgi:hypothetical protein